MTTTTFPPTTAEPATPVRRRGRAARLVRGREADPGWVRPSLAGLLAATGLLYLWNLGASGWQYWRYVAAPLLAPAFFGSLLLLFANALSAYATIQAWENQIPYVVPQLISTAMTSEVGLSNANQAQVLAVGLIIMVAVVMTGYALLQRRTARWLR